MLPLLKNGSTFYGLISDYFKNPAICGSGSSEVDTYYLNTPYNVFVEAVRDINVEYYISCYCKYIPWDKSSQSLN